MTIPAFKVLAGVRPAADATPPPVSGYVGWWDASQTSSISHTSGAVDQLDDLSGNGYHLTASGAARPTTGAAVNGLNAIAFDSANSQLLTGSAATTSTTSFSLYAVVEPTSAPATETCPCFIGNGASNGYGPALRVSSASVVGYLRGGIQWHNGATATPSSGAHILTLVRVSPNWDMRYDNATEVGGSGSVNTPTATRIGSHATGVGFLDGNFCEFIVYETGHSSTERDDVATYLADKWGITL